jgi:hypothetical protein
MQIETLPVDTLRPYPRNARTHSHKQIRQIANSIRRFGFCNPVLIDDQRQIIAGHGRVAAAKLLGMEQVPTVYRLEPFASLSGEKLASQPDLDRPRHFLLHLPVNTTGIASTSSLPLVIRAVDFAGNETALSLVVVTK